MQNKNYYTITIALLGAAKLILDSFGIKLITNQNTNDIANAIATFLTVAGVFMSHIKNHPKFSFKAFVAGLFKKNANTSTPVPTNVTQQVAQVTKTVQTTSAAQSNNKTVSSPAQAEQPKEEPAAPTNTVQK